MIVQRTFVLLALALAPLYAPGLFAAEPDPAAAKQITVYKSPTCRCCTKWERHMREQGFTVISHRSRDMREVKKRHGIQGPLQSCHTAIVDGYIIEGHVPANDVKRLLKEKPKVAGLTAPGMPQHSPGMQAEGLTPKGYDVLSFDNAGNTSLFQRY